MPKVAVVTFPGNNCETETVRALKTAGFTSEVFLWNRDIKDLDSFDGVVIPGGFSFEDRGRSGIVSSQEPIMKALKKRVDAGMPILGICNGAQIIVESGLILADSKNISAAGLLWNKRIDQNGTILGTGFYHSWRNTKPVNKKTPFSNFDETLDLPIAHGEGRFTFSQEIGKQIEEKNMIVFQYVNGENQPDDHYPVNPNGSYKNAAAICNPAGNVVAMMPHPERTENGAAIMNSFFRYFEDKWDLNNETLEIEDFPARTIEQNDSNEICVLVRLKITDKTEKTFENVLHTQIKNLAENSITRREKWGFTFSPKFSNTEKKENLEKLIFSGDLVNENKQWVVAKIDGKWYDWIAGTGFQESESRFSEEECFVVIPHEDFKGLEKQQHISHSFPNLGIEKVSHGICWQVPLQNKKELIEHSLFSSRTGDKITEVA